MSILLLKEIIGQDKAIDFLRRIAANDKIASAYLFAGIQGIGKTTTAMAFALLLNCMDPDNEDGCGKCTSCKRIIDGNHPDIILVGLDEEKKAIGINQIREINRQLAFAPVLGRYRMIIIDPAEKMTMEAANAFLKSLEEPPPGTVFILTVRDPKELLPTIVSRCQRVPFKPLPTGEIANWLVTERSLDREAARILAGLSEGSLGTALRMAEEGLLAERVSWIEMLDRAINGAPDVLLESAQKFFDLGKKGKEPKDATAALMLGIWKSWFRDMLLMKLEGAKELIVNTDLIERLSTVASGYSVDRLMKSLAVIASAEYDLIENRNQLFLIERSLFGLRGAADR
jgi:DNA polymerase-3 subunit delta'